MTTRVNKRSQAAIKTALVAAGIIPTQQRMDIARMVLSEALHFSAEQVLERLNRNGHVVSKATVYNTLGLFARKGVIREVLVDPDRLFFDSNTDEHYHLYNEDTGELTDVYDHCLLAEALPGLPEGTELVGVDVVIRVRQAG